VPPRIAKLVGLGAFAAIAAFLALFAFLIFITVPRRDGGIDSTQAWVSWISLATLFAGLIGLHVLLGRQLLKLARGKDAYDL
jgi:hypothetical protein